MYENRFVCDVFFEQLLGLGQLSYSLLHCGFYDCLLRVIFSPIVLFFYVVVACKLDIKEISRLMQPSETYFCCHILNI